MAVGVASILALLITGINKLLDNPIVHWIVVKTFVVTCFVVLLPLGLRIFFHWLLNRGLQYLTGLDVPTMALQVTGFGAWLLHHTNAVTCISLILGAVAGRFTLRVMRLA